MSGPSRRGDGSGARMTVAYTAVTGTAVTGTRDELAISGSARLITLPVYWCPECAGERGFEQPPCLDGHGEDCPERACVDCGFALLVAPLTPLAALPGDDGAGAAPAEGHDGGEAPRPAARRSRYATARRSPARGPRPVG